MNRLTRKSESNPNGYVYLEEQKLFGINKALQKLGQLEDVEDELGIDLITLFKALNNGIWLGGKDEYGSTLEPRYWRPKIFEIKYHACIGWCFSKVSGGHTYNKTVDKFGFTLEYSVVALKEHGKTWALTKEELGSDEH